MKTHFLLVLRSNLIKGPLSRRFIRNPNKEEFDQGMFLKFTDLVSPIPDEKEFVTAEVKAGLYNSHMKFLLLVLNFQINYKAQLF